MRKFYCDESRNGGLEQKLSKEIQEQTRYSHAAKAIPQVKSFKTVASETELAKARIFAFYVADLDDKGSADDDDEEEEEIVMMEDGA